MIQYWLDIENHISPTNMNMFLLYTVYFCMPLVSVLESRTVQVIKGRNVSFSWIYNNTKSDTVSISRNSLPFMTIWPLKHLVVPHEKDERVQVFVKSSTNKTAMVTVSILNIREKDAGIYKLERRWDSEDFNDSVILQIFDETIMLWITVVRHAMSDLSIQLQCKSSSISTGNVTWRMNGSLIESHGRYSQDNSLLSIKNLTADDKFNLYTCNMLGGGFESDPYRLNISGPNVVKFTANVTVVNEHQGLNVSCYTDCYPICTWNWTKMDPSSAHKKAISADNILQIKNTTRENAGKYSCNVYNIITGASLEDFTYVDVVHGPDQIYFNTSDNIIQLNEFETITLFCYAECFPPCQVSWTETNTNTLITGSLLTVNSVKNDMNCTCHATNPMNGNASISSTIYITLRSGRRYFKTTTLTAEGGTGTTDFPSTRHLLYAVLGVGIIIAVGLLACFLHKVRACLHEGRPSNNSSFARSTNDGGKEDTHGEHQSQNYWTIVSNARGELVTAIERDNSRRNMQTPSGPKEVLMQYSLEDSIDGNAVIAEVELDEYMDPIHSDSPDQEHDDYIHPVHKGRMTTDDLGK